MYNKDFSLNSRFFSIRGNDYEIIRTVSNVRYPKNCIDTIKNLTTGAIREYVRYELIKMLKDYGR